MCPQRVAWSDDPPPANTATNNEVPPPSTDDDAEPKQTERDANDIQARFALLNEHETTFLFAKVDEADARRWALKTSDGDPAGSGSNYTVGGTRCAAPSRPSSPAPMEPRSSQVISPSANDREAC